MAWVECEVRRNYFESMSTKQEEAIVAKTTELQVGLDDWIKTSGIFSPGHSVKFTLELVNVPVVTGAITKAISCQSWPEQESNYYRFLAGPLTDRQWTILLDSNLPRKTRKLLQYLRSIGNPVTTSRLDIGIFSIEQINTQFRNRGIKFQFNRKGYDSELNGKTWQLCALFPKNSFSNIGRNFNPVPRPSFVHPSICSGELRGSFFIYFGLF